MWNINKTGTEDRAGVRGRVAGTEVEQAVARDGVVVAAHIQGIGAGVRVDAANKRRNLTRTAQIIPEGL